MRDRHPETTRGKYKATDSIHLTKLVYLCQQWNNQRRFVYISAQNLFAEETETE